MQDNYHYQHSTNSLSVKPIKSSLALTDRGSFIPAPALGETTLPRATPLFQIKSPGIPKGQQPGDMGFKTCHNYYETLRQFCLEKPV